MSFSIESYRDEFRSGVADLIVPIQRAEFGIEITYEDQPDLTDIAGFYQQACGGFWLAVADGKVVGSIALRDIGGGSAALRKMFVAADWRGAKPGVAKTLLDALIEHARTAGTETVWLGTTAKFLAAHRFYEKNDFTEVTPEDLPESFPRMKVDTKFYRRALQQAAENPGH